MKKVKNKNKFPALPMESRIEYNIKKTQKVDLNN